MLNAVVGGLFDGCVDEWFIVCFIAVERKKSVPSHRIDLG
jgi:hypothetical protein